MQVSWIRVKRVGIIRVKELHYRDNFLSPGLNSSMLSYLLSSNPRYVRLARQTVSGKRGRHLAVLLGYLLALDQLPLTRTDGNQSFDQTIYIDIKSVDLRDVLTKIFRKFRVICPRRKALRMKGNSLDRWLNY